MSSYLLQRSQDDTCALTIENSIMPPGMTISPSLSLIRFGTVRWAFFLLLYFSFVTWMEARDSSKFLSTQVTKRKPLLHASTGLLHTVECHLGFVMPRLRSKDVCLPFSLTMWRAQWMFLWMVSRYMKALLIFSWKTWLKSSIDAKKST